MCSSSPSAGDRRHLLDRHQHHVVTLPDRDAFDERETCPGPCAAAAPGVDSPDRVLVEFAALEALLARFNASRSLTWLTGFKR